jgi:hypothetical protein
MLLAAFYVRHGEQVVLIRPETSCGAKRDMGNCEMHVSAKKRSFETMSQ